MRGILSRHFNINFSLKRNKTPENPLISVNISGEIPREDVAFFAALGVITAIFTLWKILRKIFWQKNKRLAKQAFLFFMYNPPSRVHRSENPA